MKSRANMVAAIIAVALMMGCALVPLACENVNGETGVTTNGDEIGDFSIANIFEAINSMGLNGGIDLGNGASLVAVDSPMLQPVENYTDVKGIKQIESGSLELDGKYTFSSDGTNNGRFEIMSGAELVLFPIGKKTDIIFDNNNDYSQNLPKPNVLVHMHSGSILTIFGQSFKLAYHDDGSVENGVFLFRLISHKGKTSNCVINFDNSTGNEVSLNIKVNLDSKFQFFNAICLEPDLAT